MPERASAREIGLPEVDGVSVERRTDSGSGGVKTFAAMSGRPCQTEASAAVSGRLSDAEPIVGGVGVVGPGSGEAEVGVEEAGPVEGAEGLFRRLPNARATRITTETQNHVQKTRRTKSRTHG
ncbi:MAG: hypothetical protein KatS3mg008_0400 [Acidimicrobiales bacterium]|nr:MAG: hypothetical protein KatS3mg008_0400 [Acidimicrobiales bacterium]